MKLPEDIFKVVNRKNWSKLFDEDMVQESEYVWKPEVMKKFIKAILKNK